MSFMRVMIETLACWEQVPLDPGELEAPPSPKPWHGKKGGAGKRKWAEVAEAEVAERDRWEECDACGRWVNLGRPAAPGAELAAPCPGCSVQARHRV